MDLSKREKQKLIAKYGDWAIVTGASSGIGREIALLLGSAGLHLILVARRQDELDKLASELSTRYQVMARALVLDLSQLESMNGLIQESENLNVGLLVAAAGFGTSGYFVSALPEAESEMLDLNCRALMLQTLHFGKRFAQQKRGGIILFSSIVAFQGVPNSAHYAATKAYVQTLAEGLALELKPQGVDILASAPGPTHSGFAQRANMTLHSALNPKSVAINTLTSLGDRKTVLPGTLSKLIRYSLVLLPRWARAHIMGRIMGSMVKKS